jgi:hypothetical protein
MSKALAVVEPSTFAIFNSDDAMGVMQTNLGGDQISPFDLPQIKVPTSGGKQWELPGLEDSEFTTTFDAIIVDQRTNRVYFSKPFGEGDATGPDCNSQDGLVGVGDPGGQCATCPLNQWGSKGAGKACTERRLLFLVLPGNTLPVTLSLPPTALRPLRDYLMKLGSASVPFYGVVTRFSLKQTQSKTGITFSVPDFSLAPNGRLEPNLLTEMLGYHQAVRSLIQSPSAAARADNGAVTASNLTDEEF